MPAKKPVAKKSPPPKAAKKSPPAKAPAKKSPTPAKKSAPPAKKAAPPPAKKAAPAAKPAKTITKKSPVKSAKKVKVIKIVPSALSERSKSKGRKVKAPTVFEHPDEQKKSPAKKVAAKKPPPKPDNNPQVKEALKKVATILSECIKML